MEEGCHHLATRLVLLRIRESKGGLREVETFVEEWFLC